MKAPCSACGFIHCSSDARAIGRFSVSPMFLAVHAGTPPRDTRTEAEQDECVWRQTQRQATPPPPPVPTSPRPSVGVTS